MITVRAHFLGAVTDEDIDRIQIVSSEVIADFPKGYVIEEECRSLDEGEAQMLDFWAFIRANDQTDAHSDYGRKNAVIGD